MPTTYFYPASRAHHALCMAIDHGFQFVKRDGTYWSLEGIAAIDPASEYRICVAPDSVHLLRPKDGDIGLWRVEWHTNAGHEATEIKVGSYASNEPYTAKDYRPPMHTVIQRNGKPFHWPEGEVA